MRCCGRFKVTRFLWCTLRRSCIMSSSMHTNALPLAGTSSKKGGSGVTRSLGSGYYDCRYYCEYSNMFQQLALLLSYSCCCCSHRRCHHHDPYRHRHSHHYQSCSLTPPTPLRALHFRLRNCRRGRTVGHGRMVKEDAHLCRKPSTYIQ